MSPKTLRKAQNLAIDLARANPYKYKVAAVAVTGGAIVSVGMSSGKTHPLQSKYTAKSETKPPDILPTLHAEIDCIQGCSIHIDTMIIARVLKDGTLGISKPCPICDLALRDFKVSTIYYLNSEGKWCKYDRTY